MIVAFALQTFDKAFIVVEYYTNTAAFAKNCENKARPQMHCNGHCQMMKKLQKEENKDRQNPERKSDNKNEVLSSKSFFASVQVPAISTTHRFTGFTDEALSERPSSIFHPPGV